MSRSTSLTLEVQQVVRLASSLHCAEDVSALNHTHGYTWTLAVLLLLLSETGFLIVSAYKNI